MFKLIVLFSFTAYCSASGSYGGSGLGSSSSGYGGNGGNGGYGGNGGFGESGGYAHSGGPITAAVQSTHRIEVRPVPTQHTPIEPQVIEVDSGDLPIILNFNSRSSRILVQQTHIPSGPGEVQSTQSEDEPHRLIHEVLKPVIQEVREVITPYRRVVQEIRPVVEEVHTVVAKGESRRQNGGGYQSGSGAGLGLGLNNGGGFGGYGGSGGLNLVGNDYGSRSNVIPLGGGGLGGYGGSGLSLGGSTSSSQSYKS